ncbi:MAG TPA: hypothetical protein VLB02_03010 [Candidatus Paceibacterota bacterium]|nr:hypothetical protein [Candidatus Paceibacterota bacterium]
MGNRSYSMQKLITVLFLCFLLEITITEPTLLAVSGIILFEVPINAASPQHAGVKKGGIFFVLRAGEPIHLLGNNGYRKKLLFRRSRHPP